MAGILTIASLFKVTDLVDYVRKFNYSRLISDTETKDFLNVPLAPIFGDLSQDSIKALDADLKIAMLGALKIIAKTPSEKRNWEVVMNEFMQTGLLSQEKPVNNSDSYVQHDISWFKFDGSPSAPVVHKVLKWFEKLILNDDALLNVAHLNSEFMANIVAATGATVASVEDLVAKTEFYSRKLTNIGILQFPDSKNPYFRIASVDLEAWRRSMRVGPMQDDSNGIKGVYFSQKFVPRTSILSKLAPEKRQKMVEEAEKVLFEHLGFMEASEAKQAAEIDQMCSE